MVTIDWHTARAVRRLMSRAFSGRWWRRRDQATRGIPISSVSAILLPADALQMLQRLADVMPWRVVIFTHQLRLCGINPHALQTIPDVPTQGDPHLLDVAPLLPEGATVVALLDRLAIAAECSLYHHGITAVKLRTAAQCFGYWVMLP